MTSDTIRFYGNMVWTNHALMRLKKRGIAQSDALAVMRNPDKTVPGNKEDTVKFIRTINGRCIHVVGVLNDDKRWVVTSVWVRGEEDKVSWYEALVYRMVDWIVGMIKNLFKAHRRNGD